MTLPGAAEGLKYYLLLDFADFSLTTVLAAMGQLFYSMSLAMGIMITYGSYMKKEDDLESSVGQIEIFDTGIAFLAGLMIVPAVVAFNGGDASLIQGKAGPGLMFGVLPKVFESFPLGGAVGAMDFSCWYFLRPLPRPFPCWRRWYRSLRIKCGSPGKRPRSFPLPGF